MIKVQVRSNEPLEAALRRFKRQCNYAGIFRLAKKYAYHEKRSDKRRREDRERIRNIQRAMRKMEDRGKGRGRRKSKVRGRGQQSGDQQDDQDTITSVPTPAKPTAATAAAPAATTAPEAAATTTDES